MHTFFVSFIIVTTILLALDALLMGALCITIALMGAIAFPRYCLPIVLGGVLALLQVGISQAIRSDTALAERDWQKPMRLVVDINAVLYDTPKAQSVLASVQGSHEPPFPHKLKITRYSDQRFIPGERCSLWVKLKPIRGYSNPGGRDFTNTWESKRVTAQGYVLENQDVFCELNDHVTHRVFRYRQQVHQFIEQHVASRPVQSILIALALGEKEIDATMQTVLRRTGTAHLLAISGLHVGLVGLFILMLMRPLAKGIVILKWCDSSRAIGWLCSLAGVLIYILMTGSAVSSQRAGWMYAFAVLLYLCQQKQSKMRLLLSVMCLMMIINAYVVLDIGFWLSCGMVAILIVVCGYSVSPQSGIIHMLKVQWRISCVGFPLTLLLLQQGSLMSPLANIIAIPVVSFGVVPLLLLMDCTVNFQPELAQLCLTLSNFITEYLMLFLSRLSELPLYMEQPLQHPWMAVALGLSGILFALPRGLGAGILGFYFLMIVIVYPSEKPEDNEVWVTWLDVGQGLSTVIQTKNHVVVYDTGPQFESFDVATFTLIPFLKYHGVREIDMLIVSHADNDHRGGVNVVLETFQVHDMRVGQRLPDISMPQSLCHEDKRWEWDGVLFEQLNVPGEWKSSNNHSCVLKITASGHTVLLLGDLERDAEAALLRSHPGLSAQIISVPHHGSKTSSTLQLLEAVKPEYAIFSSGFLNRYHHPHPTVLKRYDALGIKRLDTGKVGAIRVTLDDKDDAGIICHRDKKCLSTFYRAGS